MTTEPISITFRHIAPSDELSRLVQGAGLRIARRRPAIRSLRVTVGLPHRHQRKGKLFRVRVELGLPGQPLVARALHPDPRAAVTEAFRTAERVVSAHERRPRSG